MTVGCDDPPTSDPHAAPAVPHLIAFAHDGHHFEALEEEWESGGPRRGVSWTVTMDGAPALEFHGPYPYRDEDVRRRVLEWYTIQRAR